MALYIKKFKLPVLTFLILLISAEFIFADEEANVYMGRAIQNYLEGNIEVSIENLAGALLIDPQHSRAKDLLERASSRILEDVRETRRYDEALEYLVLAESRYSDSEVIRLNLTELRMLAGYEPTDETVEAPAVVEPAAIADDTAVAEYRSQIEELNRRLQALQGRLNRESGERRQLEQEIERIMAARSELETKLAEEQQISAAFPLWPVLVLITALILLGVFFYIIFKTETVKVVKNIIKERRDMEDLKSSYGRDTEKLAKKLEEYGRAYQRADHLEENWEKIIKIIEKLSEGGSTSKVVLPDSPGGRKAVTGIDPRVRGRADSVEVIAEIFSGSPKAPEMLRPFLTDEDNRTRANAAVAYHRYDPEKSAAVLKEMAENSDKWMRLSAAWAMGEVGSSATTAILEKLLDDTDTQVKNRARLSFEKIMQEKDGSESVKKEET